MNTKWYHHLNIFSIIIMRTLYGGSKVRESSLVKRPKFIIAEISSGNMGQISFRSSREEQGSYSRVLQLICSLLG